MKFTASGHSRNPAPYAVGKRTAECLPQRPVRDQLHERLAASSAWRCLCRDRWRRQATATIMPPRRVSRGAAAVICERQLPIFDVPLVRRRR